MSTINFLVIQHHIFIRYKYYFLFQLVISLFTETSIVINCIFLYPLLKQLLLFRCSNNIAVIEIQIKYMLDPMFIDPLLDSFIRVNGQKNNQTKFSPNFINFISQFSLDFLPISKLFTICNIPYIFPLPFLSKNPLQFFVAV